MFRQAQLQPVSREPALGLAGRLSLLMPELVARELGAGGFLRTRKAPRLCCILDKRCHNESSNVVSLSHSCCFLESLNQFGPLIGARLGFWAKIPGGRFSKLQG